MQPRQTDAVDQFVASEADGDKAEASRYRESRFLSMNRNASEESSLPGITSVPSIPRHAELGPVPAEAGRPLAEPFVARDLPESWAARAR